MTEGPDLRGATPMRQYANEGDDRNKGFCIHCGGADETSDHNPSKVFLDAPLPANLPVASSCQPCNQSFSDEEEYLACLLECAVVGVADPDRFERPAIARSLHNNQKLLRVLQAARTEEAGGIVWSADMPRVERVVLKLARGLAAFELNEPRLDAPDLLMVRPILLLNEAERDAFESRSSTFELWPEIGSRAFNRAVTTFYEPRPDPWIVPQAGRFRYRVSQTSGLSVFLVLRGYLAAQVCWG